MKTDKKSPINLVSLFAVQNSKKDIRKSFINTNYKSLKNLNDRSSSLEAYINSCICYPFFSFLEIKNDD
jgi:hypothetical protein